MAIIPCRKKMGTFVMSYLRYDWKLETNFAGGWKFTCSIILQTDNFIIKFLVFLFLFKKLNIFEMHILTSENNC